MSNTPVKKDVVIVVVVSKDAGIERSVADLIELFESGLASAVSMVLAEALIGSDCLQLDI